MASPSSMLAASASAGVLSGVMPGVSAGMYAGLSWPRYSMGGAASLEAYARAREGKLWL